MWGPLLEKSYILYSQALARHQTIEGEKFLFKNKLQNYPHTQLYDHRTAFSHPEKYCKGFKLSWIQHHFKFHLNLRDRRESVIFSFIYFRLLARRHQRVFCQYIIFVFNQIFCILLLQNKWTDLNRTEIKICNNNLGMKTKVNFLPEFQGYYKFMIRNGRLRGFFPSNVLTEKEGKFKEIVFLTR